MCPGLTSKGGNLPPNIEKGSVVVRLIILFFRKEKKETNLNLNYLF